MTCRGHVRALRWRSVPTNPDRAASSRETRNRSQFRKKGSFRFAKVMVIKMKKGILIALLCVLIAAAAVAAVLIVPSLSVVNDPLMRTLAAVSPGLKDIRGKNLRLTLSGTLEEELLKGSEAGDVDFSALLTSSVRGETGFRFYGESDKGPTDLYFTKNDDGILAGSDTLTETDTDYYIGRKYIREALSLSVLAPDSDSPYALSEDRFGVICALLDPDRLTEEGQSDALFDRIGRIVKKTAEKTTPSVTEGKVELFGETVTAEISTVKLNKRFLLSLIDAVEAEYGKGCVSESVKEKASESRFSAELKWAVYKKYLVLAEGKVRDGNGEVISFRLEFTKDPKKDPSRHFELKAEGNTEGTLTSDHSGGTGSIGFDFDVTNEFSLASFITIPLHTRIWGEIETQDDGDFTHSVEGSVSTASRLGKQGSGQNPFRLDFELGYTSMTEKNLHTFSLDNLLVTGKSGTKETTLLESDEPSLLLKAEFSKEPFPLGTEEKPVTDLTEGDAGEFADLIDSACERYGEGKERFEDALEQLLRSLPETAGLLGGLSSLFRFDLSSITEKIPGLSDLLKQWTGGI